MSAKAADTPRGDLLVIHDLGPSIEAVIFAGGKEIARVPLTALGALFAGQQLVEAAGLHLRRKLQQGNIRE